MKIKQTNLAHTGYFVTENGKIYPAFTSHQVKEGRDLAARLKVHIKKIYGTLSPETIEELANEAVQYCREYGVPPRFDMEQLRNGVANQVIKYEWSHIYT